MLTDSAVATLRWLGGADRDEVKELFRSMPDKDRRRHFLTAGPNSAAVAARTRGAEAAGLRPVLAPRTVPVVGAPDARGQWAALCCAGSSRAGSPEASSR